MTSKLKIFRMALLTFIVFYTLAVLLHLLITFTGGHSIPKDILRISFFGTSNKVNFYSYLAVSTVIDILLIYSLMQLLKIGDYFKNSVFFNQNIICLLRYTGKNFTIVAVAGFFTSMFYHYTFSKHILESMLLPLFYHLMVLVVGLGLSVIKEIQKRALSIKVENDLTI